MPALLNAIFFPCTILEITFNHYPHFNLQRLSIVLNTSIGKVGNAGSHAITQRFLNEDPAKTKNNDRLKRNVPVTTG